METELVYRLIARIDDSNELAGKMLGRMNVLSSAVNLLVRNVATDPVARDQFVRDLRAAAEHQLEGTDDSPSPHFSQGVMLQLNTLLNHLKPGSTGLTGNPAD